MYNLPTPFPSLFQFAFLLLPHSAHFKIDLNIFEQRILTLKLKRKTEAILADKTENP